jgi:hypothetical protein
MIEGSSADPDLPMFEDACDDICVDQYENSDAACCAVQRLAAAFVTAYE